MKHFNSVSIFLLLISRTFGTVFDIPNRQKAIRQWEQQTQEAHFWNDQKTAREVLKSLEQEKTQVEAFTLLESDIRDVQDLLVLASTPQEENEIDQLIAACEHRLSDMQTLVLFSGAYDDHNALLTVRSGAGGVDAQDWASMLLRMYMRWCERKYFRFWLIEQSLGQEAGIKSATIQVVGQYAYGKLLCEAGVHRLVRLSPFNAANLRQTSFASVEVMPEVRHSSEVLINDVDLRIDTFRSSGAGGQHVNKTESAIRITHIPTGLVASCQTERSQLQNRERAMHLLKAKLLQRMIDEQEREKRALRGEHISAEWGNQIRSYVLHPYQMVKDHRSGFETSDTNGFLDGDIDATIEACLRWKASNM